MMTKGQFLFLGTGGSMGIPVIGCHCAVCSSSSRFNKRLRPSALITTSDKQLLIDCSPDFRYQALTHGLSHLDGVVITHAHHDHTGGIDDLRVLYMRQKAPLPCLLSQATADDLKERFSYIFQHGGDYEKLIARFDLEILKGERGKVNFQDVEIGYMTYTQGGMPVNGYRFGNLAFVSDIRQYPETIFEDLKNVKILIVSALRFTPSPLHFNVDEAIEFAQRVGADHTWLTHIAHELDHEKTNSYLPSNIQLAYDGLSFEF